jgi:hypothetical protein
MSYFYLATPYSKYPAGIECAFIEACKQTALLIEAGIPVYSPIAHTHPIAIHSGLDPLDHSIWLPADKPMMDAAKALIVCKMEGWESSYGISVEIEEFHKAGKPVYMMTPGVIPTLHPPHPILGIMGVARAGKDTAAQALVADGWTRVALADGVRGAAMALDPHVDEDWRLSDRLDFVEGDWDTAKKDAEIRRTLQRMGTEAGRQIHGEDCWIKLAKKKIDAAPGPVVITDVRFANEAEAIRSWGGKIIKIERPGVGPCNGHSSEALDFEPNISIDNFGSIEDLHRAIRKVAASYVASLDAGATGCVRGSVAGLQAGGADADSQGVRDWDRIRKELNSTSARPPPSLPPSLPNQAFRLLADILDSQNDATRLCALTKQARELLALAKKGTNDDSRSLPQADH